MKFLQSNSLAILILLGLSRGVRGDPICRPYPGDGVCSNYIASTDYIYLNGTVSFDDIENSLGNLKIAQGLSPFDTNSIPCVEAFTSFACGVAFPKCTKNESSTSSAVVSLPCESTCTNVNNVCSDAKGYLVQDYIKTLPLYPQNCSQISPVPPLDVSFPTSNCNAEQKVNSVSRCFPPLIEDTLFTANRSQTLSPRFCKFGCCLPCPQPNYLYPSGHMDQGFLATQIVRAISAIAAFIVMLSHLVLPGRRSHPSSLILFVSISIFLYSVTTFFSIGDPRKVQCVDAVNPSNQENNGVCAVQGALLIFASHATALWTAIIILNLHVHTVWNSNFMADKYAWLHIVAWGIPFMLTIIALIKRSVAYQFAELCLIKQEAANAIFFYPLAVIVIPSFAMHTSTFFHIAKISQGDSVSRSQSQEGVSLSEFTTQKLQVLQAVKIQWRALLLAVVLVVTVITYWLFYFIELRNITNGPENEQFLGNWLTCIQSNRGQDECSKIARGYMPSFGLLMMTEFLASFIGIWLLAIFSNAALWKGWVQWFGEKFRVRQRLDVPDQFLAI